MKKPAFTLIELIVALAIVSLLVAAISMILSLNLSFTNKAYLDEKSYKQASHAALYIEDKIRRAYKITKNNSSGDNFTLYITSYNKAKNAYEESSYEFSLEDKVLYVEISNMEKFSEKNGKIRICELEYLYLHYDDSDRKNQYVEIIVEDKSKNSRIESYINLGEREWKGALLVSMFC